MSQERVSSLLRRYDLSVETLDYQYVEECQDPRTLESILRVLRSGEEGSYPHLLRYTEQRLATVHPGSRVLHPTSQPVRPQHLSSQQLASLEAEMAAWASEIRAQEEELIRLQFIRAPLPPVRGSVTTEGAAVGGGEASMKTAALSTVHVENLLTQGRLHYQAGDNLQASLCYQKVLASDPLNTDALRGLAALQERPRVGEPLVQEIS
ncbi:sperm-associated antigen 1 [Procambarus clarkii]|uniref:sperm-associated antigen 1 n=1 Tax=Procambarus clarkii TaxID=6728 RepID=UPI001E677A82|nr:sperm-associated antigen 1-like [Procambarus clarkii]XP_045624139.1 sperm-associated antigen 1-like [Procambarus clarkii]